MQPSSVSPSKARLPALVVGASAFGRFHVRELVRLGYGPIAIVGSNARSAAATIERLQPLHPVPLIACADVAAGLATDPSAVTICTPPPTHLALLRELSRSAAYVMCEKPMFWDPAIGSAAAASIALDLLARFSGRLVVNHLNTVLGHAFARTIAQRPGRFRFAYSAARESYGQEIAIDLLPHALSVLIAVLGPGEARGIERTVAADRFDVAFDWNGTACRFELRRMPGPSMIEIECDGVIARRDQRAVGERMAVALAFGDGRRVETPNPLEAMFDAFDRALRSGSPLTEYDELTTGIVRWSYALAGLE
jgi:predicted dehydrogenase